MFNLRGSGWGHVEFVQLSTLQVQKVSNNFMGTFAIEIFSQSFTIYFTSSIKSTPYGDVAFKGCTQVELLYLEVETAVV